MAGTASDQRRYTFKMDARSATPVTYANFAMVDITPFEAIISFGLADPATALQAPASETQEVAVQAAAVARIVLPRPVFKSLAETMARMVHSQVEAEAAATEEA